MTVRDSGGNVQVDFVWGNFPLQPNDDRGGEGQSELLDAALDNHVIATTGYSNFPGYIPNYAGDGDTGLEVAVPNVVGLNLTAATAALEGAGLVVSSTLAYPAVYSFVSVGKNVTVTHDGDYALVKDAKVYVSYDDGVDVSGTALVTVKSASAGTFTGTIATAITPDVTIESGNTGTLAMGTTGALITSQGTAAGTIVNVGATVAVDGIDVD